MNEQYAQNSQGYMSNNSMYQNLSFLQLRLDIQPLLDNFEQKLHGKRLVPIGYDDNNQMQYAEKEMGLPYANKEGVRGIMNWIETFINTSSVQGNWNEDEFNDFIFEAHEEFAFIMTENSPFWGLANRNRELLISMVLNLLKSVLSRLKDNLERESYASSTRIVESNTVNQNKGLLDPSTWFNKGGNVQNG